MENKILKSKEIDELKKKGIDPFSDTPISYRFTISVNTKRLAFFEMFYFKFLGDSILVGSTICSNNYSNFYKRQIILKDGVREPDIPLKGPSESREDILIEGLEYTRIKFEFDNCHPLVVAKVITDLTDCINFTSKLYGYDTDGSEILLIKYPIGTVVNIRDSGDWNKDYIVSGYNYERDINEFTYVIKRFEDGEMKSMMHMLEDRIKPSRGNNLDILLGLK
jgi:hypothetical protein